MRISDWSSDVCSSDLIQRLAEEQHRQPRAYQRHHVHILPRRRRSNQLDPAIEEEISEEGRENRDIGDRERAARRRNDQPPRPQLMRSEEHTSELHSLMRISYAVFCLKKKKNTTHNKY